MPPHPARKSKAQVKGSRFQDMLNPFEEDKVSAGGNRKRTIEVKSPTSFAARKRRRATLSMKEVFAESSKKETEPTDHAASFNPGSTAFYTWGVPNTQPIPAVQTRRRHKSLRTFGRRRSRKSAFAKFIYGSGSDEDYDSIIPFRFLDLPLEVRWIIYSYLLIHPKSIPVHSDWRAVHLTLPQDHAILRVSKQILLEATQFLYEKNTFHAIVNTKRITKELGPYPNGKLIKKEFLPYLRNVIVDGRFDPSDILGKDNLEGPIADCLNALVTSGAILDSITLMMTPVINPVIKLLGTSTALNIAKSYMGKPIPQYFKAPSSKIMRIIPKLRCKVLNIIVRMPDGKRVLVSLNLKGLPVNQDKSGWFANDNITEFNAIKLAREVKANLWGLEKRFEDIFKDYEKAIMEGKARLMDKMETKADGMKLSRG